MNKWSLFRPGIFMVAVSCGVAWPSDSMAQAVWNAGTSDWFTAGNWNPAVVPTTQGAIINNGGTARIFSGDATADYLFLGSGAGTQGTLDINGSSSSLSTGGGIGIGSQGTGTLIVRGGGTLSAASISLGGGPGGMGTLDLRGNSFVYTGGIISGSGTASLLVQNATVVSTGSGDLISGFAPGEITLTGAGLTVDSGGFDVQITSQLSGAGRLTKTGAGTLTLTTTNTFTDAVRVTEGTLIAQGVDSLGTSRARVNGPTSVLQIATGAVVSVPVELINSGTLINNGNMMGATATELVAGFGSGTVINNGQMQSDDAPAIWTTTPFTGLNVTNNGNIVLTGTDPVAGAINVGAGSVITNNGTINASTMGIVTVAGTITNTGTITAGGRGVVSVGPLTLTNSGLIESQTQAGIISLGALGGTNITNLAGGEIRGATAAIFSVLGATNLVNAGTITGAVVLGPGQANTVTLVNGGTINGTLIVGPDAGSQLILDGTGNSRFSEAVTGGFFMAGGSLTKQGSGTWTIDQAMPYAGPTTVNEGTLYLNGSVTGNVVVNGGVFGGTGTVGGNLVNNFGAVNVGNSPGILNVGGNFVQGAGGTFVVEVAGNVPGLYDQLNVGGTATMGGGLVLQVLPGYVPAIGETYNFLTAGGGGIGQFATFTTNLNGSLRATLGYGPTGLPFITIVQGLFTPFAFTPNQQAVAANLDTFSTSGLNAPLFNYLNGLPGTNLPDAYDQISPDEYASMSRPILTFNATQQSNLQRRFADIRAGSTGFSANGFTLMGFDRSLLLAGGGDTMAKQILSDPDKSPMRLAKDNKWGFFVNGTGQFGDVESDGNGVGYDFVTGGINLGLDYRLCEEVVVGASLGYANSNTDTDASGGNIKANNAKALLYASWFKKGWYVNGAAGGGGTSYDTKRNVLGSRVTGDTYGGDFTTFLGTGYDFKVGALTIGPAVSLEYSYVNVSQFTESGGLAPLQVQDQNFDSLRSRVGLLASTVWECGEVRVIPTLNAAWQHEFMDTAGAVDARFASGGGGVFGVRGAEAERDSAILGLGLNVEWTDTISTYLAYDAEAAERFLAQSVNGGVRLKF